MRGEPILSPDLNTKGAIHAALQRLLPAHDPFWPRWLVTSGQLQDPLPEHDSCWSRMNLSTSRPRFALPVQLG